MAEESLKQVLASGWLQKPACAKQLVCLLVYQNLLDLKMAICKKFAIVIF
ncbi:MAG: hypothetical protein AAI978_00330 [Candidatus Hodgkinia cicadicola]